MYRVAARILRDAGRSDDAEDVVMAAMESLMKAPPTGVQNWEAMMVRATKMRALDLLGSAAARHASSEGLYDHDVVSPATVEDDVIELVDRQRAAAVAWDKLALLDDRHRRVAWEYIAKERPRGEVAAELGVSPARVSQMAAAALRQLREALVMEGVEP
jgi:RNA polymerase sigma-70 factor (ECF subfamily)